MIRLESFNSEKVNLEHQPKAASETFTYNDMVGINTSGYLTKYADGSSFPLLGLVQKTVAATDSDYASNTRIPVLVGGPNVTYRCDVSTGTAAQTDVGEYIDVDDENSVNVTASTNNDFYVVAVDTNSNQVIAKMARQFSRVVE